MNPADPTTAALDDAYTGITDVVADLDDRRLLLPTGCHGWLVADLLLHVTGDAQRALVALATPADGPPDVDAASYWRDSAGGDDRAAAAHAQWVRRSAAAFQHPSGVVRLWCDTAPAAVRAATAADPTALVRTQGLVLRVPDLLATLVTEAVVHHLDLVTSLPDAARPGPRPLAVTLAVLLELAGGPLPPHWEPSEAVLKGSGRAPLSDADRRLLGARADAFPLLG